MKLSSFVKDLNRPGTTVAAEQVLTRAARGDKVLDLRNSGTSDRLPAGHILEESKKAIRSIKSIPSNGLPELRGAISVKLRKENGISADPDTDILITTGAKEAIFIVMAALITPGDEVLLHTPNYVFDGAIRMQGGVPVYLPTRSSDGFYLHLDEADSLVNPRTRLLILCNPVNPTGHLPSSAEVENFGRFADRHGLVVMADESYEKYVYDGHTLHSLASYSEFQERVVTVQSFSKSYSMTAYRVGYMLGPSNVISACRRVMEWLNIHLNPISQWAAWSALTGSQDWVKEMVREWQSNRDYFVNMIKDIPQIKCCIPQATGFAFLDVSAYGLSSTEVTKILLEQYGIPSTPGKVFHGEGYIRLPFGGSKAVHRELISLLKKSLREWD